MRAMLSPVGQEIVDFVTQYNKLRSNLLEPIVDDLSCDVQLHYASGNVL